MGAVHYDQNLERKCPMPNFPVDVVRTPDGDYTATLVDLKNGPAGHGVDPYAALQDLVETSKEVLANLEANGELPDASPAEDRPIIEFSGLNENAVDEDFVMRGNRMSVGQKHMICYSWTNDVMFLNP